MLDVHHSTKIVRKLKLTGVWFSGLEIAKFEGANIRAASGISGQTKNVLSKPDGTIRATFEEIKCTKAVRDFSLSHFEKN